MGRELKKDDQSAQKDAVKQSLNTVLCDGLRYAWYCSVHKHPLCPSNCIQSAIS